MSEKNKKLCDGCDACCRYVAIEIDKPTSKRDWDHLFWYLHHKNINVFIDWSNDWLVEFVTPCEQLDEKTKLCRIYNDRPQICREHSQDECVRYAGGAAEKYYFKTPADLEKYLKKKKIDYKFKNKK